MSKYKKGDKVVVEIEKLGASVNNTRLYVCKGDDIFNNTVSDNSILGKLEDFQPKQEKIKFTPEMKKEFDRLKIKHEDMLTALDDVSSIFNEWLFLGTKVRKTNEHQYLFALAWHDPSLIEVVEPEKHIVKVASQTLYLDSQNDFELFTIPRPDLKFKFTLDEVKEAEKQLGIQGLAG